MAVNLPFDSLDIFTLLVVGIPLQFPDQRLRGHRSHLLIVERRKKLVRVGW